MRALDYLLTRDEVDPKHLGIMGNSGGGTMTMWLCGLEPRCTMAAPGCAVTTFRRNFDNELPTDTEQMSPLALKHGLEHGDFLSAMAPKPVIILAAEKDFFDVRGSIETYERLRPLWRLLGAERNLRLFIGPNEHGYTQPNREAMYGFFNQQTLIATGSAEPKLTIEKDETLWCTPKGQIALLGSKTVMSHLGRVESAGDNAGRPRRGHGPTARCRAAAAALRDPAGRANPAHARHPQVPAEIAHRVCGRDRTQRACSALPHR